jgi:DNA-binding NarL/FixJ family response regulator
MGTLSLYIVDDHQMVREGLRALINAHIPRCEIVGEADNGRAAVADIKRIKPDIVLMDISMPELNGVDAVNQISKFLPDCKIIALSMHGSTDFVTRMLSAGAKAYLKKDEAFSELNAAIDAVSRGEVFLGHGVADILVDDYKRLQSQPADVADVSLTPRERQVVQLVAEGRRTREIAARLSLSTKTIESHRTRIMRKLGIDSVADLTKYAIRVGITDLNQ